MRICVTESDIKNGERMSGSKCPIATAVKRQTGAYAVSVSPKYIRVSQKPGEVQVYVVPTKARDFITNFDDGVRVSPFEFEAEQEL